MPKEFSNNIDGFGIPVVSEMANLGSRLTGLPKAIHIWSQGEDRRIGHGPRVKVSFYKDRFDPKECIAVTVSDDPQIVEPKDFQFGSQLSKRDFEQVRNWVISHKEKLIRYWSDPSITVDDILSD